MNNAYNAITILLAEDDEGHAALIRRSLKRAGVSGPFRNFRDGQAILNFLFSRGTVEGCYLLLLDIRMPRVDGVEVLRRVKKHSGLKHMPTIMLTTSDDPREVELCHALGCNAFMTKPVEYGLFVKLLRRLGRFVPETRVPEIDGTAQ